MGAILPPVVRARYEVGERIQATDHRGLEGVVHVTPLSGTTEMRVDLAPERGRENPRQHLLLLTDPNKIRGLRLATNRIWQETASSEASTRAGTRDESESGREFESE